MTTSTAVRTPAQVRRALEQAEVSVAQWAVENGFNPQLVYAVLKGDVRAMRGQSLAIALALGLKKPRPTHLLIAKK